VEKPAQALMLGSRLVGICDVKDGEGPQYPFDCRPLNCQTTPTARRSTHERRPVPEPPLRDPAEAIGVQDSVMLCLSGTGLGRETPAQIERYAMALNCGNPCKIPAPAHSRNGSRFFHREMRTGGTRGEKFWFETRAKPSRLRDFHVALSASRKTRNLAVLRPPVLPSSRPPCEKSGPVGAWPCRVAVSRVTSPYVPEGDLFRVVLSCIALVAGLHTVWSGAIWLVPGLLTLIALGRFRFGADQARDSAQLSGARAAALFVRVDRPEMQQYFVESNSSGRPFSREQRSLVYRRAKNVTDTLPFGTEEDVYAIGYEWMNHSLCRSSRRTKRRACASAGRVRANRMTPRCSTCPP
jgi:hypothetical protein